MNQLTAPVLEEANAPASASAYLKTVFILLDAADATADEETCLRCRTQARDGCRNAPAAGSRLSPEQQLEIEDKLAAIRARFKNAGVAADPETFPPADPGSESQRTS